MTKSKQSSKPGTHGKVRIANPTQRKVKSLAVNKSYPLSVGRTVRHSNPRISSDPTGTLRIAHKEYIRTEVYEAGASPSPFYIFPGSASYGPYDVNPGFSAFMPWGSEMAKNWERYRFHSLAFHFIPKQPTTCGGNLIAFFDYDFDDAVAVSKQEFLTNQTSETASTFQPMTLRLSTSMLSEGAMNGGWRFVSNSAYSGSTESRETMAGFLMLAVDSAPANSTLSWDVWVEYDVELKTARPSQEASQGIWLQPVDEEGVPVAYDLKTRSPATGSYVSNPDETITSIASAVGQPGTVLGAASSPSLPGRETSAPQPWQIFRLQKPVVGGLEIELSWDYVDAQGGTAAPSSKGTTNTWEVRAYAPNSSTVDDSIAKAKVWSQIDNTVWNSTSHVGQIKTGIGSNPSTAELTTGLRLAVALNETFWATCAAAGVKPSETLFGVVNTGNAVMAASMVLSGFAVKYIPFLLRYHRELSAPYPGRRGKISLRDWDCQPLMIHGCEPPPPSPERGDERKETVRDTSTVTSCAGQSFAPAGRRLVR